MDYDQALAYLAEHYSFESNPPTPATAPNLDRMVDLVAAMGDPHLGIPTIHVAGTNGKGSTSRMAIDLLVAHNLDVGGYSSPHIERINERITVNGEPLDDESFAAAIDLVATVEPLLFDRWSDSVTFFELTAAASLGWGANTAVDALVLEVGLGGTWDATNVVEAEVAVVTNIELDHVETLGPKRRDIAGEKAGIISPRSFVVVGEPDPELLKIFSERPSAGLVAVGIDFEVTENRLAVGGRSIDVRTTYGEYQDLFVGLHGAHQGANAAVALVAVEAFFGRALEEELVAEVFSRVVLPARFEVVGRRPLVIIDGAHNPAGAAVVRNTLFDDFTSMVPPILVVGFNTPRDPVEMLRAFGADQVRAVVATAADWSRAIPADRVAEAAAIMCDDVISVPSVAGAVDSAIALAGEDGTVFIGGSLYVAGEARSHLVE